MFASLNYLHLRYLLHQNKLHYIDQHLIGQQSVSAFWIFPLVSEKIGSKVGQQEIFRFVSHKDVTGKIFQIFLEPDTLLCTNISRSFQPNFVKIRQIYILHRTINPEFSGQKDLISFHTLSTRVRMWPMHIQPPDVACYKTVSNSREKLFATQSAATRIFVRFLRPRLFLTFNPG